MCVGVQSSACVRVTDERTVCTAARRFHQHAGGAVDPGHNGPAVDQQQGVWQRSQPQTGDDGFKVCKAKMLGCLHGPDGNWTAEQQNRQALLFDIALVWAWFALEGSIHCL